MVQFWTAEHIDAARRECYYSAKDPCDIHIPTGCPSNLAASAAHECAAATAAAHAARLSATAASSSCCMSSCSSVLVRMSARYIFTAHRARHSLLPMQYAGSTGMRVCGATRMSGTIFGAEPGRAIDGNSELCRIFNGNDAQGFMLHSLAGTMMDPGVEAWWQVDLGAMASVENVRIVHQRNNLGWIQFDVKLSSTEDWKADDVRECGRAVDELVDDVPCGGIVAQFVTLLSAGPEPNAILICEVEVWGTIGCSRCAEGKHQAAEGAATCEDCPPSTFSSAGSTACQPCAPGEFESGAACTPCEPVRRFVLPEPLSFSTLICV
eukprot:SAG22_NODE_290_length_12941_cov_3.715465_2_plen_323_part_00